MARVGLQQMLGAQPFHSFLEKHWPQELFVSHGHETRIRGLQGLAALQGPDSLFTHWPGTGRAWSPRDRQQPAAELPADQLAGAYRAGHTIYLTHVERHLPELTPWIRGVERDLGLRRGDVTCEVICSHTGQGAKAHFDPNMTVNVQLLGRKAWRVAANKSIVNPDLGLAMGDQVPAGLRRLLTHDLPTEMPADATAFETSAGSIVFLPHGCWHATECAEPSMALLFTVVGNSWCSMLGSEVADVLRQHERSRATAVIPPPGAAPREQSRQQLRESLDVLRAWVDGLDPDALLRKWAGPPLTTFTRTSRVEESVDHAQFLDWVEAQGGVFHSADAIEAFPDTPPNELLRTIWALESRGILTAQ